MVEIKFEETPEFLKDMKRLSKRYRTLPEDFDRVKKLAICLFHQEKKIDNRACFEIPGCVTERFSAYKVKKIACRSLKGGANSGLRVIYIYDKLQHRVLLIEIYYKGDQALENRARIKSYLSQE